MDEKVFTKKGVDYFKKPNGTIYCTPLPQDGMVGGNAEEERNAIHNPTRLERIRVLKDNPYILDYGCGFGKFVDYLKQHGFNVEGYDKYSSDDRFRNIGKGYDIVVMTEVIEHISEPFSEIDEIFSVMNPGGVLMIETSFSDWLTEKDNYINPEIGHCTIFSHRGLDELMSSKGLRPLRHINRNVRLYTKPTNSKSISLITMGQGNINSLKTTLESTKDVVDEIVFGDMLLFPDDRRRLHEIASDYKMKIIPFPFNYIFQNGFSSILNELASCSTNDLCLYLNVSEIISEEKETIKYKVSNAYNSYYFTHRTDPHRWVRLYNKLELNWSGLIHEEVVGNRKVLPTSLFVMADTEKDMDDPFKAKVFNDCKEIVYFNQYLRIVDNPELKGATHIGWLKYAQDSYDDLKKRLHGKGKRYEAFVEGNYQKYMDDILNNPEFAKERFESSTLLNFQGARKDVL